MQTLTLAAKFDQDNTFAVEVQGIRGPRTIVASLHQGYQKVGDGVFWAMKRSACLKDVYTAKDAEERARLAAMTPIRNGVAVSIGGQTYIAKVLGNYSDCVIFKPQP